MILNPGKKLRLSSVIKGTNEKIFTGVIISNSLKINNDGSELHIEAKDEIFKMTINKGNRHFNNIKGSDVATQLLDENGIPDYEIENSSFEHKQLVQSNISDWDYMIGCIDVSGMMCVIDNAQVMIRKPDKNADAKLKLTYGDDILELNANMDARIQNDQVKTSVWDFTSQSVQNEESEQITVEGESPASEEELAGVSGQPYEMRSSVSLSTEEIKSIADAKKVRQVLSKIKGRIKYQGTNKVLPGDFMQVEGVGLNFSGKIFVSAIRHECYEGDWTTEATLGWNEQFFAETIHPSHAASATGQVSSVQGLQIGVVTDIMDSDGEYRIKIRLPAVNENDEGIYARVATLDAGDNRGTFFRPEIGDEVVVGFMNNDVSYPVILGMLHSSAKSSPIEPQNSNNQKGYVSRNGIKLVFDDGSMSVKIETPGGRVFELNDSENTITIDDGTGNKITMEQSGVTVEAAINLTLKAGATLSLAAPQLAIKADGMMSVEGSGGLSVKSSGITEIQGSLVKIN